MQFRTQYSKPVAVTLKCLEKSLTQQQFKDEVDINKMLAKFKIGVSLPGPVALPSYGDFTGIKDYRSALDAVRSASAAFASLPLAVRQRFQNDPQQFLEFATNADNLDALREMGLAPKAPDAPPVVKVEVVNPPAST